MRKLSRNKKETGEIAKIFLDKILNKKVPKGARVVGLYGNLGAGKTAFVKAIAKHLAVKEVVNSPTFVIIKRYPIPERVRYGAGPIKKSELKTLFHLDAYRLKNEHELLTLGWEEIIKDDANLVFIEWPENVEKVMPRQSSNVHIAHEKGTRRSLKLS
ncbi:MAG: tRNA (adenosine(37)-N6)-threonylcarbamoyltransferase complex ATPase subunit type 1 TsaE [Candidatus Paceibacterota bacterium]|jgi:tRNA threonylcarbamoyladenosine biosynthesis protein TsaE